VRSPPQDVKGALFQNTNLEADRPI